MTSDAFPKTRLPFRLSLYFRLGHGQYFSYLMGLANFSVITYVLAIERIPVLLNIFPTWMIYMGVMTPIYFVSTIFVGMWHVKKGQLKTQQIINTIQSPPILKILDNQKKIMEKLEIK